ncbi:MarR family winged helix-turn-helix transcriptional regulator [Levilactobacillus cerevisiae]|uniref:MarR family winged helix-turn-helix transcriptional regulator n=1 Tax=Levilactobacillus cerevisiae TaxID=1704076 RepID=UPI000F7B7F35|nr:MarR family transcriptional regulator [Levilactobacillus cerevisiae]
MQRGDSLASQLYQVAQLENHWLSQQLRQLGLNNDQARALDAIAQHPNSNQRQVAQRLQRQAASTSNLLRNLTERGLIERRPSPVSKREKVLQVTIAGEATVAAIQAAFQHLDDVVKESVPIDQQRALQAHLTSIAERLQSEEGD